MADWTPIDGDVPPEGELLDVITPGGDHRQLIYESGLWFLPDRSMYVYFVPAFWRPHSARNGGRPVTTTEAHRLVNTALIAQDALTACVHHYRGVDLLSDSTYRGLLTERDDARDALVAALVGGGS